MKKIAILALTMITLSCFSQENRIDIEKIKALKITSITGSSVSIKNGFVNTESSNTFFELYNEDGKLTDQFFANLKGENKTKLKLYYGKCNKYEKSEDIEKVNGKEKITKTNKIIYDNLCRETKIIWIDEENKITETEEIIYNTENQKISNISKNPKNEITSKIVFSYPEKNIEETKAYFENEKFWYHHKIKKDENGNEIESISFDENGKIENKETTKYQYNNNKKIIEELHFDENDKLKYKKDYLYNSDNLIERVITTKKEVGINMPNLTENINITVYYYTKE
ncbi:hypothetical protein NAT51_19430 [Flavobacterium amniphilum]|uniref:hypothetical protein n=1 Tax=Flavobacterium amniphilum TaxID=1834035 RepID=UPI00202A7A64|nr:hypothetical protein [Flavobacterium amniphilum]MCL9807699.1 hypothetical protein [Flavobacterium amniphilum]